MPQRFLNLQEKLPSLVTFWIEEIYISVKKRENCWQDMLQAGQFARIWAKFQKLVVVWYILEKNGLLSSYYSVTMEIL